MSTKTNNAFSRYEPNLGTSPYSLGLSREDISHSFSNPSIPEVTCLYCTAPPTHKIIPKHPSVDTEEVRTKGYVCEHCLKKGYLSPESYGIRKL